MASSAGRVGKRRVLGAIGRHFSAVGIQSAILSILRALIVLGISYVILFPLIVKFSVSFMSRSDIWDQTVSFIPKHATLNNYRLAYEFMKYPLAFFNSFKLALLVSVLQLGACTFVAYGFARFRFKGSGFWFALVIFSLVIPPEMIATPLYLNFRFFDLWGLLPKPGINLLGSFWPFVLTSITGTGLKNGLFIYIMRQLFMGMPRDLEEAAYVDGAGPFRTFFKIMLPPAIPGMVVVFLFAFVWQWNDYQLTTLYMNNQTVLPITLDGLAAAVLGDQWLHAPEEFSLLNSAGGLMVIAPLILLYMFLQKYFVESVERTGITG